MVPRNFFKHQLAQNGQIDFDLSYHQTKRIMLPPFSNSSSHRYRKQLYSLNRFRALPTNEYNIELIETLRTIRSLSSANRL